MPPESTSDCGKVWELSRNKSAAVTLSMVVTELTDNVPSQEMRDEP